jgi:hypothetical protein
MKEDVPWYVSLIVSFLPLIIYTFSVLWLGWQIRKSFTTADGRSLAQVFAEIAADMKRPNPER